MKKMLLCFLLACGPAAPVPSTNRGEEEIPVWFVRCDERVGTFGCSPMPRVYAGQPIRWLCAGGIVTPIPQDLLCESTASMPTHLINPGIRPVAHFDFAWSLDGPIRLPFEVAWVPDREGYANVRMRW